MVRGHEIDTVDYFHIIKYLCSLGIFFSVFKIFVTEFGCGQEPW